MSGGWSQVAASPGVVHYAPPPSNDFEVETIADWTFYDLHYWILIAKNIVTSGNWQLGVHPEEYAADLLTRINGGPVAASRQDFVYTGTVIGAAVGTDNRRFEVTRGVNSTGLNGSQPNANNQTGNANSKLPFPYGALRLTHNGAITVMDVQWWHFARKKT